MKGTAIEKRPPRAGLGSLPRYGKRRMVSWRLPEEVRKELEKAASYDNKSVNEWVIRALLAALAAHKRMKGIM